MRLLTPEISWHQREPIYSLDFQQGFSDFPRLGTVGVDGAARIWKVDLILCGKINIDYLSTVRSDCGALNTIRFSPDGQFVAFCGVSGVIYVGHHSLIGASEFGEEDKERWVCGKTLRGHLYDVQVLEWSSDSRRLVSGSIDNTVIVWEVEKGQPLRVLRDSRGYVQGVGVDPRGEFIASLGNDRVLRIYNSKMKQINYVSTLHSDESHKLRMWSDEICSSLFRRMDFSPDGEILVVPSGTSPSTGKNTPQFASYVFSRINFSRPIFQLLHFSVPTLAVRFNPIYFKLRESITPWVDTPYRQIFAVASVDDILLYDTQQRSPFSLVGEIHCTSLSDISWSPDGRVLAASSTDGFISFIEFDLDELGQVYSSDFPPDTLPKSPKGSDDTPLYSQHKRICLPSCVDDVE